jgi:hypothetical protein
VIALADHLCEALEGFYVYNTYVPFAGDGAVAGYNGQLEVFFRPGSWAQAVPSILTTNAPLYPVGHPLAGTSTWTSADHGRGVAYVVVAYKADAPDAKHPVWSAGQPTFLWKLKGLKTYSARQDTTVGGSGAHRWADDATRAWSNNLIDCRYTWVRGIYVEGHVADPKYLLLGRGLTAEEAPPANVFAPANLCDEDVPLKAGGTEKRYRIGGTFGGGDAYIDTENDFAAACGGIIVDRGGSVELVPGAAETPVWSITDDDLVEQTTVTSRDFRSKTDTAWVNMVSVSYTEPTQKWAPHAAPLHSNDADVAADQEPRLAQPRLNLVTSGTQAQRVGEIVRRKGRLWRTRGLVLPPRLAGAEHGDWLVWTSRRYGPHPGSPLTPLTFRIVSDGQGADWRNSLALEEISAFVYDWDPETDEVAEGSVAVNSPDRPDVGAPDAGDWSLVGSTLSAAGGSIPALVITGAPTDTSADAVVFDYRPYTLGLGDEDDWNAAAFEAPTVTRKEFTSVTPGTDYQVSVRYRVHGVIGDRLILGPVTAGQLAIGGARRLATQSVGYPFTSDDTNIYVADFDAVLTDGTAVSFPAGTISGLSAGVTYALMWNIAGGSYSAVSQPASAEMASSAYAFLTWQTTSDTGVYPTPDLPPDGYGGDDPWYRAMSAYAGVTYDGGSP